MDYRPKTIEVNQLKQVQVPPLRRKMTLDLPTLSKLEILQGEAGNRTQSGAKADMNPGVNEGMTWANRF